MEEIKKLKEKGKKQEEHKVFNKMLIIISYIYVVIFFSIYYREVPNAVYNILDFTESFTIAIYIFLGIFALISINSFLSWIKLNNLSKIREEDMLQIEEKYLELKTKKEDLLIINSIAYIGILTGLALSVATNNVELGLICLVLAFPIESILGSIKIKKELSFEKRKKVLLKKEINKIKEETK